MKSGPMPCSLWPRKWLSARRSAERITEDADIQEEPAKSTWTQEYLKGIGFGCLGIIGLTALILGIRFLIGSREPYAFHPARRGRHEKA